MPIESRQFRDEADYVSVRRLVSLLFRPGSVFLYCSVGDLDWWRWTSEDPQQIREARLWLDEQGEVVGIAWPRAGQVELLVHPDHAGLQDEMLDWYEEVRRRETADSDEPVTAINWPMNRDVERIALLRRRGYQRGETFYCVRSRDLARPIPQPALPEGYQLRHVRGEEDLERRVAVHRDAFAPSRMTVEKHRRVMASATYRPELDLVVEAPDGSFAAYSIAWFDPINRLGVFEPVGCHSAHRRRGLARAVLYEGMRRLKDLGAHTAYVVSLGDEGASARLYDSVGLIELDRTYEWKREL